MKSKSNTIDVCQQSCYSKGLYLAQDSKEQIERIQSILLDEILHSGYCHLTRMVIVTPDPSNLSYLRMALESGGIITHDFYPEENYYSKLTQHEWSHDYYEFSKLIRLFEMIVDNDGVIDNALMAKISNYFCNLFGIVDNNYPVLVPGQDSISNRFDAIGSVYSRLIALLDSEQFYADFVSFVGFLETELFRVCSRDFSLPDTYEFAVDKLKNIRSLQQFSARRFLIDIVEPVVAVTSQFEYSDEACDRLIIVDLKPYYLSSDEMNVRDYVPNKNTAWYFYNLLMTGSIAYYQIYRRDFVPKEIKNSELILLKF